MSSKKEQRNETHLRILEATWKILEMPAAHIPSMSEVARAAGISRQAVYLHFTSRAELLISTIQFIDERQGLPERLAQIYECESAIDMLDRCVEIWGAYLPEIKGISAALIQLRDSDPEVLEAWNETVRCLTEVCKDCISRLSKEGLLARDWTASRATAMFAGLLSIPAWDELRRAGWSNRDYISNLKLTARRTFCI
ncbi:MAG: TetR/AcrR family transcriptional regulator [Leptospiraceae bacterium]